MHQWFVDATPLVNEEFTTPEAHASTVNGTTINYGRGFSGGAGPAAGFDLLTVLIHEIGHALSFVNPAIFVEYADGDVDVTAPRPMAGVALPLSGVHLGIPAGYVGMRPVMFPTTASGERRLISDADLLFVAQSGLWQQIDSSRVAAAPEPATLSLLAVAAGVVALRRRSAAR